MLEIYSKTKTFLLFHFHLRFVLFIIGSSIGIDVSEQDGLQTGSTTIMSGSDVEKILRIIKETDEEFKEKEKQILDEFERRRKEENIKEMEKELKKQKREQEKLRKENEKAQKKRDKMEKEEQRKKEKEELANKKKIEAKMKKEHEAEIRRLETDAKQNRTTEVDSRDKTIIDKEKQLAIEKEMSQYRITPDIDKKSKYDTGNKKLGEVEAEIQLEEAGNPFEEYAPRIEDINERYSTVAVLDTCRFTFVFYLFCHSLPFK